MNEKPTTFSDNTLNLDQAYYYTLLLLIDTDTFAYAVVYKTKLMAYGDHYPLSELAEPKQLQEILSVSYKKIIIGYTGTGFTLVPHQIFNQEHIAELGKLLDVKENEKVLAQVLDDKNYAVYKVPAQQLALVDRLNFKNIVFAGKALIKVISQSRPLNTNLYLNVIGQQGEFIYFRDELLRFYNRFEFKSSGDLAYYSALVMNELDLQTANTSLLLSGSINAADELYKHLSNFFPQTGFNTIPLLEMPQQIPSQQILALAGLLLCGSSEVL
jgi:Protein of unknown function (DUF3822)